MYSHRLGSGFQLLDVAWPGVRDELAQGGGREPSDAGSRVERQIVVKQHRNVLGAVSQRWHDQMNDVEAIEEIVAELVGPNAIEHIGADNVMIETDYPHTDSTWPHCIDVALEQLDGHSDEVKQKVLVDNAVRVFNIDLPKIPAVTR